ncbi:transposase [Alkaliphilus peptidifermentans]|uniref:REP element-mobilizing transposase RayT n=1 Tax=Alkaliphilus peptidifermentans DSM 18978 TaxID=1120976 RepID=A0A1G5AFI0_9FIRM|nr:transposase [Alkaliphilus peptidifermentans]SCX76614.1 REP element-mobilizing transposase RayT [Alkaliphilus peptidifermentans DSM 18978]
MPRRARDKSSTGTYHVMLRGINGQKIFEDYEDYRKLLDIIKEYKEKSGYEIYAYCLMSNHIHLLIKEGKEDLGIIFRRIGAKYVYWYNWKYKRRGHLFQDRYKSEVVEDDSYFLTVLRYIHQNPLKAGIEKDIKKYLWTSYKEYIEGEELCETKYVLTLFSRDKKRAIPLFESFHAQKNNDKCLDYYEQIRLNDIEATEIIKKTADVIDLNEIQNFESEKRNELIKQFKNKGLSIRQIERLTGISFGVIRRL